MLSPVRLLSAICMLFFSTIVFSEEGNCGKVDYFLQNVVFGLCWCEDKDFFEAKKEARKSEFDSQEEGDSEGSSTANSIQVHYKLNIPVNITCWIRVNESLGTALKYRSFIDVWPHITENITTSTNLSITGTSLEENLFTEKVISFKLLEKTIPKTGFYPIDLSKDELKNKIKKFLFLNTTLNNSFVESYDILTTKVAWYTTYKLTTPIASYVACWSVATVFSSTKEFCLPFASLLAVTEG